MEIKSDINVYMNIIKRRKFHFIIPFIIVSCVVSVFALMLPPIYRSEATILIEGQDISEDMVQSTGTGFVEERIQSISQKVLSTPNLLKLIKEFDLYPEELDEKSTKEIVNLMKNDISIEPVHKEITNPHSGRAIKIIVAFTIAFKGKDPQKVAQISESLVSLYLKEDSKMREEKAETTVQFLRGQLENLNKEILEIETRIAEFKDKNLQALPELMQLNLQELHRTEQAIDKKKEDIKNLQDKRSYLESQLATLDLNISSQNSQDPNSQEVALEELRNQYLTVKASHSNKHPDVIRLKKQLQALENQIYTSDQLQKTRDQLEQLRPQLIVLKRQYSDKHPDVIKTKKTIEQLQSKIESLLRQKERLGPFAEDMASNNPSVLNLKTQLKFNQMEILSVKQEIKDLQSKHEELLTRLEHTPQVEQRYNALQRDYENAKIKYNETKARLQKAKEAQDLEEKRIAQKLTLVDPPTMPEKPFEPNRLAFLLIGTILSFGAGTGVASLSEFLDQSIHTVNDLERLQIKPILASIPYLETKYDRIKLYLRRTLIVMLCVFAIGFAIFSIHMWYYPLDDLWVQLFEKISITL